jgi:hypothetical protein
LVNSTVPLFLFFLTVVVVLNLAATVCLMPSAVYSAAQKALQLMLIWVLPLVGAILVLSVWVHDRKSASRDPIRSGEGPWLPGIGPERDRGHHGGGFGDGAGHDGHGGGGDGGSGD